MKSSMEIFNGGFIYGNPTLAAECRERLNKKYNLHESIRWELARKGGLTYRQLVGIFGGVSENRILDSMGALSNPSELLGIMPKDDADKIFAALAKAYQS